MTLKINENFEDELSHLSVQNWHKECDTFWLEHSKISKMCFWPKYVMLELRKYRGIISDGTEDWYKIWRKTDMCFQNWYEESGKHSPEHSKV